MRANCSHKECEQLWVAKVGPWRLCLEHAAQAADLTAQALAVSAAEQAAGVAGKTAASLARCPSYSAQQRHKRRGETCEICNNVITVKARVAACGTMAGYRKHLKEKEPVCPVCAVAMKEVSVQNVAKRRERRGLPPAAPAQAPVAVRPPQYEDPRKFIRQRGTHCGHCPQGKPCKDYHIWDCKLCVAESAVA